MDVLIETRKHERDSFITSIFAEQNFSPFEDDAEAIETGECIDECIDEENLDTLNDWHFIDDDGKEPDEQVSNDLSPTSKEDIKPFEKASIIPGLSVPSLDTSPPVPSQITPPIIASLDDPSKPIVIKLKKGLSDQQIRTFIYTINSSLIGKTPLHVNVTTEDWPHSDERLFPLIPAAKKLFARFCHHGLLGCLVARANASPGIQRAVIEVYAIAYVKAKQKGSEVVFSKIDHSDFLEKMTKSAKVFDDLWRRREASVNVCVRGGRVL